MRNRMSREKLAFWADKQRQKRAENKLKKSQDMLNKYREEIEKYDENDVLREWSTYWYEEANLRKLAGDASGAVFAFVKHGDFAQKEGDKVSYLNAEYHKFLMEYLSGQRNPMESYVYFIDVEKTARDLMEDQDCNRELAGAVRQNLMTRLCDLSFETQSADFERWRAQFAEDPITEQYRHLSDARFLLADWRNDGRSAYLKENYDEAAAIWSSYLNIDHSMVPKPPDLDNLEGVSKFFNEIAEETARDYRDAGRSIYRSTVPNAKAAAVHVWESGLKLNNAVGNQRYLADIQHELSTVVGEV